MEISLVWQYHGSRNRERRFCGSVRGQRGWRRVFLQMDLIKFADKFHLFGGEHGIDPIIGPN
jgi:hypothetical protein